MYNYVTLIDVYNADAIIHNVYAKLFAHWDNAPNSNF